MTLAATHLFWATAHALSHDLKVFLASGDQDTCRALAQAGAKELVYLSPEEAPCEGVKARADYRERASSKDLIVDPEGSMPADEVERLLKKKGAYLSGVDRALGEAFVHRLAVTPSLTLTSKAVMSLGEGEVTHLGNLSSATTTEGDATGEATEGAPLFFLFATQALPTLPALSATVDAPEGSDPSALSASLEAMKAELKKAERAKSTAQKGKSEAQSKLKEALAEHATMSETHAEVTAELKSVKRKLKTAQGKADELKELKVTAKALDVSLAERDEELSTLTNTAARQAQELTTLKGTLETERAEREALSAELEALKASLKEARREAKLHSERKERVETAERARKEAEAAFELTASAWVGWLSKGVEGEVPTVPAAQEGLARRWADQLLALQPLVSATREEHQELLTLRVALRESEARERLLTEERDAARLQSAAERARGGVSDETIRAELSAERALRTALEARLQEQAAQVKHVEESYAALQSELDAARRQLAATSSVGASGDVERALRAELASQTHQRAALEQILTAQQALQAQLTTSLREAIEGRATAELARESAEARVRLLELQLDPELRLPSRPQHTEKREERREERPRRHREEKREERPRRQREEKREERPTPSRSSSERLGDLSARLKRQASAQEQRGVEASSEEREAPRPKLNPLKAADRDRVRQSAERLKAKVKASAASAPAPQASTDRPSMSPSPLEQMSDEERTRNAERARAKLKESVARLHRK